LGHYWGIKLGWAKVVELELKRKPRLRLSIPALLSFSFIGGEFIGRGRFN